MAAIYWRNDFRIMLWVTMNSFHQHNNLGEVVVLPQICALKGDQAGTLISLAGHLFSLASLWMIE